MANGNIRQKGGAAPSSGFTLIELVVAIAIVGVLTAIAFPFYQEHINKARRAEAIAALTSAAAAFERYKASNNFSYADACSTAQTCTNKIVNGNIPDDGAGPFYVLTAELSADNRSFVLTATATSSWAARDGLLQIDNTGAKRWKNKNGDIFECFPQGGSASCDEGALLDPTP